MRGHQEAVQTNSVLERHAHQVGAWRCEQLAQAGFPRPLAMQLAEDSRYDLHALIGLVERGCRPELAIRILAPLEGEAAA